MDVCRSITFLNYHIIFNAARCHSCEDLYITTGFFDAMFTQRLEVDYKKYALKSLWHHTLKCIRQSEGRYSYQNTFCFGHDKWNHCQDKIFWDQTITDLNYPLTFVMFIQLKEYLAGNTDFEHQCRKYADFLKDQLGGQGIAYVYATVDKNDIVICIKSRNYKDTVKIIKEIHKDAEIVYSHSIFSVSANVLSRLSESRFDYLNDETLDSICLKGITNSYEPLFRFPLDQKYIEFCELLICAIYDKPKIKDACGHDFKIYDILGDDDFRLIARAVNLKLLLQQLAPGGLLSFSNPKYRYFLFSSSLIINTESCNKYENDLEKQKKSYAQMTSDLQAPHCTALEKSMDQIKNSMPVISKGSESKPDEKVLTYCHAVWQLLQSLKALEAAPTKKYDFFSLYKPFEMLVHILETKLKSDQGISISQKSELFEFIHKISMTLHGTQRTDIQFFQIKDFNVIVHYAPAKLRAFYSLFALKVSDFYNSFCDELTNQYSFILSPGMFPKTSVHELFQNYKENRRLMLITMPERHLYETKYLGISLAHEAAHFVGYKLRSRPYRHQCWLTSCARIVSLELSAYAYHLTKGIPEYLKSSIQEWFFPESYETILKLLQMEDDLYKKNNGLYPHTFHSRNSTNAIQESFDRITRKGYVKKTFEDIRGQTLNNYNKNNHRSDYDYSSEYKEAKQMLLISDQLYLQMQRFYALFQNAAISPLLELLKYVSTETYADTMAILTLEISLESYIDSYFSSDFTQGEEKGHSYNEKCMLPFRWAVVIRVISNAVNKYASAFRSLSPEFYKNWMHAADLKLKNNYKKDSLPYTMLENTYKILHAPKSIYSDISKYSPIYNIEEQDFINNSYDFFNDRIVKTELENYLNECIRIYMKEMCKPEIRTEQEKLRNTYKNISGNSCLMFVQEIENFLSEYKLKDL